MTGVGCFGKRLLPFVGRGWRMIVGRVGDVLAGLAGLAGLCPRDSTGAEGNVVEGTVLPSRPIRAAVGLMTVNTSKVGSTPRDVRL